MQVTQDNICEYVLYVMPYQQFRPKIYLKHNYVVGSQKEMFVMYLYGREVLRFYPEYTIQIQNTASSLATAGAIDFFRMLS